MWIIILQPLTLIKEVLCNFKLLPNFVFLLNKGTSQAFLKITTQTLSSPLTKGRALFSPKQHSVLFWHCEVSERIFSARTLPETTVALTVVEKRCLRQRTDEGCVFLCLVKYTNTFQFSTATFIQYNFPYPPLVACGDTLPLITKGGKQGVERAKLYTQQMRKQKVVL